MTPRIDLSGGWYLVRNDDNSPSNQDTGCWFVSDPRGVLVAKFCDDSEADEQKIREFAKSLGIELDEDAEGKAIKEVIASMAARSDSELFALTEDELRAQWWFKWDERGNLDWNVYEFSSILEMHKERYRRWEEHHHGSCCVVERVRDKYIMSRIREFRAEMERRQGAQQ